MTEESRCRAWLSIIDYDLDSVDIGLMLNLSPTSIYREGLPVPLQPSGVTSGRVSEFNRWEFKFEVDDASSLQAHLINVESVLSPSVVIALRSISASAKIVFEFELVNESGIFFPESFIQIVADCGGCLDIDVRE